jgi:selenocysteine lyase/cysteine desulfurase
VEQAKSAGYRKLPATAGINVNDAAGYHLNGGTAINSIDIERVRIDTPGCTGRIHFNNAGAALPPRQVVDAMVEFLRLEAEIGGYEAAAERKDALERPYHAVARLIGANRDEIALTESATRAWQLGFYSVPLKRGDRILASTAEYPGNYISMLHRARQTGAKVELIPNDESGTISLDALRNAFDDRVRVIALTHVPTNNGLVNPAAEVGRIAREAGAVYMLDAAQSAGQIPLDVGQIACDMLAATGRKYLRGPRGTGFLYVRKALIPKLEPPLLDWASAWFESLTESGPWDDARRFETWETSLAARIGLGVAVDYGLGLGVGAIQARVAALATSLREMLRGNRDIAVTDVGQNQSGIVTFRHARYSIGDICHTLSHQGINVYPRDVTPLDRFAGRLEPVVRASVHYYNTEEEIERFCAVVESL